MKATEYKGELFFRNNQTYTKFTIGNKVVNSRIERLVISLGGKLTKETTRTKQYEINGDYIRLCML